ncbi:MAG: hypothetical protein PHI34_02495 [Acidobacteriota bacterium]|nr:hypothetical protein [Acidobacteriota bacterium]
MIQFRRLGGIAALTAVFFLSAGAVINRPQDATGGMAELKKKIAALEERVAGLEAKIQKITVSIPQSFPDLKSLPEGWRRFEHNGQSYYLIPLDLKKTDTPALIR